MNEYEYKLAVKRANADAKKAVNKWRKFGTVSIDDILVSMGYCQIINNMYRFEKRYWAGMETFTISLDTYGLVIGNSGKIEVEVK